MIQLGELVFAHLKKMNGAENDPADGSNAPSTIKGTELDALQYVAGYVVYKFLVKARNSSAYNSVENQAIIMILEAMIDTSRDQKLIDCLSRGGLTPISSDCELLFYRTEETFRVKTTISNLRKIDVPNISSTLMCQPDKVSVMNAILETSGINIEPELRDNIFEQIIRLYLRVRSFALARDITSRKKSLVRPKAYERDQTHKQINNW